MPSQFLANLQQEGDRIDENPIVEPERKEKETPSESPADNKPNEDAPASSAEDKEKDAPKPEEGEKEPAVFHRFDEHPRWKAREEELKGLREFRERAEPLLERLENPPEQNTNIPSWFTTLYGANEEAWNQYKEYDSSRQKQIKEELRSEFEKEQAKRTTEQKRQDEWVETELKSLEAEGFKFNKNELMKVALDYLPTDQDGNISLKKAYDILNISKTHPQPNKVVEDKKKVADQTIKKSLNESDKKDYKTSADFKGRDFRDYIGT